MVTKEEMGWWHLISNFLSFFVMNLYSFCIVLCLVPQQTWFSDHSSSTVCLHYLSSGIVPVSKVYHMNVYFMPAVSLCYRVKDMRTSVHAQNSKGFLFEPIK